jgi:hypothetical protein
MIDLTTDRVQLSGHNCLKCGKELMIVNNIAKADSLEEKVSAGLAFDPTKAEFLLRALAR